MTAIQQIWAVPPFGAERGFMGESDALPRVTHTVDNVDLNDIWTLMQQALATWNEKRSALTDVLSFWTTSIADAINQAVNEHEFEEASEYGEPQSFRPPSDHALLGYQFSDFDLAARYSWKALRDMDQRQVLAIHNGALNSDNALVTKTVLQRLFSNVVETNHENLNCYGLWTGNDGLVPPKSINGHEFDATHTHYKTTQGAVIDSGDVEDAIRDIRSHGRGLTDSNERILLLVNEVESETVQSWRAGQENANTQVAKWDFIPAVNQPSFVLQGGGQLVGNQPTGEIFKLPSVGAYGPATVVESSFIPAGYFAVVATAGPGAETNVVGVREHTSAAYRGFRHIPGQQPGYPLIESFYNRSFGTGVRHRGAAICQQVTESATYEIPQILPNSVLAGS